MVPPLTVVSTSLSIAANAFKACKDTYELVRGIQEAPTRILRLSTDLHGVYTALGTLQSVLNTLDVIAQQTGLPGMIIADLEELLFNCIGVFVDIRKIIQPILSPDGSAIGGTWKGFKWESFKKGDVEVLQRMLSLYKSTLTFACFSLNLWVSTSLAIEYIQFLSNRLIVSTIPVPVVLSRTLRPCWKSCKETYSCFDNSSIIGKGRNSLTRC